MKVKTVPIESIIPNEKNVRLHGHAQLEALKQSYLMFGQFRPIVIDENNIILAGHGIWKAMIAAGAKECSVYQYDNLSNAQKLKLMLADNKTQELGTFNFDKFDEVIKEISLDGDLSIPGYDSDVLDMIVKQQNMDTGALDEKMRPWLQPIHDALDLLMRPTTPLGPRRKQQKANATPGPVAATSP